MKKPKRTTPIEVDEKRPDILLNVKVKALKQHGNTFGDKFIKEVGDEYIHPHPQPEIDAGIVEVSSASSAIEEPANNPERSEK